MSTEKESHQVEAQDSNDGVKETSQKLEVAETGTDEKTRRNSYAAVEFTPEISKQCLKQMEFYFSEFNFPYDKFLRTLAEKNEGWVPISTIATFNRMKRFRPIDKVVEVVRTSSVLEISPDGENVKRRVPLDMSRDARLEQSKKTVAVMNFPHDEDLTKEQLQLDIETFFGSLANVNQVRLRKDHHKNFNGTVLVEFATLPECEEFMKKYGENNDDTDSELAYKGKKLTVLTKKQYDLQREATKSKNFSGSGQRARSFTGHRKNMPK